MAISTQRRLILFTGSGISADSGLDTFRTSGGESLWAKYDPEVVCNFDCWEENFTLVHEFYSRRREELGGVAPNKAHHLAVDWEKRYNAEIITQNVDDLFERAGARYVMHVHGFLTAMRCVSCSAQWYVGYKRFDPATDRCPKCGRLESVKPSVVFFNEPAPRYAQMWKSLELLTENDVLVAVGTSGQVLPIGQIARRCPATTILSNLESAETPRDEDFDHVLHGRASEIAPDLDKVVTALMER
jgi:NAD-dependent deacetylase